MYKNSSFLAVRCWDTSGLRRLSAHPQSTFQATHSPERWPIHLADTRSLSFPWTTTFNHAHPFLYGNKQMAFVIYCVQGLTYISRLVFRQQLLADSHLVTTVLDDQAIMRLLHVLIICLAIINYVQGGALQLTLREQLHHLNRSVWHSSYPALNRLDFCWNSMNSRRVNVFHSSRRSGHLGTNQLESQSRTLDAPISFRGKEIRQH